MTPSGSRPGWIALALFLPVHLVSCLAGFLVITFLAAIPAGAAVAFLHGPNVPAWGVFALVYVSKPWAIDACFLLAATANTDYLLRTFATPIDVPLRGELATGLIALAALGQFLSIDSAYVPTSTLDTIFLAGRAAAAAGTLLGGVLFFCTVCLDCSWETDPSRRPSPPPLMQQHPNPPT